MGMTGLVFGVVAAVWLIYLIPLFLNGRENGLMDEVEPGEEPFSPRVTVVRRGVPLESPEESLAMVSTPLNRRAALRELARTDADAAARRRRVLGFLVAVTLTVVGLAALNYITWWWAIAPLAFIVGFLGVARFSVRSMREGLAERARVIRGDASVDEETVVLAFAEQAEPEGERSVVLVGPVETAGSLWDPVPIPAPTYISGPPTGRTVRTIDLSAPPTGAGVLPVTADRPEAGSEDAVAHDETERAAGA